MTGEKDVILSNDGSNLPFVVKTWHDSPHRIYFGIMV